MPAKPDQMLSHCRLTERIGEGGMGVVWKAEDTVLNRVVAIKVLPADAYRDEKRCKMFLHEAQLISERKTEGPTGKCRAFNVSFSLGKLMLHQLSYSCWCTSWATS